MFKHFDYKKFLPYIIIVSSFFLWIGSYMYKATFPSEVIIYQVAYGDTLWDIAESYIDRDNRYIQQMIYDLKEDNPQLKETHGQVFPGQKLIIKLYKIP